MDAPRGYAAIVDFFGDPKFDGHTVDQTWEEAHMVMVRDFPGLPVPRLYVHKAIVEPLRAALAACVALGDGYAITRIGCFAPRFQRGSESLVSIHTFGAAVDINPDANPLIAPSSPADPRRAFGFDIPPAWVAAFTAQGFMWGGDFSRRFDPMHFQFATGF